MELFHEMYGRYYTVIEKVIAQAQKSPLTSAQLRNIIEKYGFGESNMQLMPLLENEEYPLLIKSNGLFFPRTSNPPERPLSLLEKRWIATIIRDPMINLFIDEPEISILKNSFAEYDSLFDAEDFYLVDQASDVDPIIDLDYQNHFKCILGCIVNKKALIIHFFSGHENEICDTFFPHKIEYSQKDGKFRLLASLVGRGGSLRSEYTINLARIHFCEAIDLFLNPKATIKKSASTKSIVIRLSNERNALERACMHFANFQCHSYTEMQHIHMCIEYFSHDETELLIRVLSFGPVIRVLEPQSFILLIQQRLISQMICSQNKK